MLTSEPLHKVYHRNPIKNKTLKAEIYNRMFYLNVVHHFIEIDNTYHYEGDTR